MHFGKLVPMNTRWFCQYDNKLVATLLRNSNSFSNLKTDTKNTYLQHFIVSVEGMYVF